MRPLSPGDPAPDIRLETPFGVEVSLRSLLERGPVAVEFIRGTWDPNARERMSGLDAEAARLKNEYGARNLLISCERVATARAFLDSRAGDAIPLVVDRTGEVAKHYGVFQRFSFGAFHVARPATFVVDRCGFIRYAHVGRSPIQIAPLEDIVATLEHLRNEGDRTKDTEG